MAHVHIEPLFLKSVLEKAGQVLFILDNQNLHAHNMPSSNRFCQYSQEVTDAVYNILGTQNTPQKRHNGLRILQKGHKPVFWQDGRQEWALTGLTGTCPTFDAFSTSDWDTANMTHIDGNVIKARALQGSELPSVSICEYSGKNLAPGSSVIAHSTHERALDPAVTIDNFWNNDVQIGRAVWFASVFNDTLTWLALDLGTPHSIRMFRWQNRPHLGYWNLQMEFYASDLRPVEGEDFLIQYATLCGKHPHQEQNKGGDVRAMTCSCLVVGRYAIVRNSNPNRPLQFGELAFFGLPYDKIRH